MTINKAQSFAYGVWFFGREPSWIAGQAALGRVLLLMLVAACANEQPEEHPGGEQCLEGERCTADQDDLISTLCGSGLVDPDEECEDGNVTAGDGRELYRVEVAAVQLAAGSYHTCALLESALNIVS